MNEQQTQQQQQEQSVADSFQRAKATLGLVNNIGGPHAIALYLAGLEDILMDLVVLAGGKVQIDPHDATLRAAQKGKRLSIKPAHSGTFTLELV